MLKWFNKKPTEAPQPQAPKILGLGLGGAFELDALRLRMVEPAVIFENASSTQFIQAVGQVQLDADTTLLRYYTDDDAFIQVLLQGGLSEQHIVEVKLWYFYSTQGIAHKTDWEHTLRNAISLPEYSLEGHTFTRVWNDVGQHSPPVAMTEETVSGSGERSETDQFAMLYEREAAPRVMEYLLVAGEEKIINDRPERALVISTGIDLDLADLTFTG